MNAREKAELDNYITRENPDVDETPVEETAAAARDDYWNNLHVVQQFLGITKAPTIQEMFTGMAYRGFDVKLETLRTPRAEPIMSNTMALYDVTYHVDVRAKVITIEKGSPDKIDARNQYYGDGNGSNPYDAVVEGCARAIRKIENPDDGRKKRRDVS